MGLSGLAWSARPLGLASMKPIGLQWWKPIGFRGVGEISIKGTAVVVTGGIRGRRKALVRELSAREAGKAYAAARGLRTVTHPGAVSLALEPPASRWS